MDVPEDDLMVPLREISSLRVCAVLCMYRLPGVQSQYIYTASSNGLKS